MQLDKRLAALRPPVVAGILALAATGWYGVSKTMDILDARNEASHGEYLVVHEGGCGAASTVPDYPPGWMGR